MEYWRLPQCESCPDKMVPQRHWRDLSAGQRDQLRQQGFNRRHSSTKCYRCYTREKGPAESTKELMRARSKALTRLSHQFPEEFKTILEEELEGQRVA